MCDTICTLYDITATLDDIIQLFVCHGNHYVYDIISTIYDVTHTVCMTTQALYLSWNQLYLLWHTLHMSSQPLCRRHHTNYIRHHRWHMCAIILYMTSYTRFMTRNLSIYDITCTLFMTSHALYMTCPCMISNSLYVLHHRVTLYVTSHTLCLWHIHFIWHHTQCYENKTIM